MAMIEEAFAKIPAIYIADGHHRCASAVKVGLKRREQHPDYTGEEEFNYFLSVIFPDEELQILDYNRVVKDLNGLDVDAFLAAIEDHFMIEKKGRIPYRPEKKELSVCSWKMSGTVLQRRRRFGAKMLWKDWMYLFYKITC